VLTRGRTPGVSLVAATQRPSALPAAAVSQAGLLLAHRLTAAADVEALSAAAPTYLSGTLRERLPTVPGDATRGRGSAGERSDRRRPGFDRRPG
jgi:DNA helicase HerA-like ATPase